MVWLISYPRSGTNWVGYIIENVCRLPVDNYLKQKYPVIYEKYLKRYQCTV